MSSDQLTLVICCIRVRILRVIQDGIILLDKHPLDQDCLTFTCTNCSLLFQPFGFSQLGLCRSESTGRPGSIYSPNWQYITLIYHLYIPPIVHFYTTYIPLLYLPSKGSLKEKHPITWKKRPHFQKHRKHNILSPKKTPPLSKNPGRGKTSPQTCCKINTLFPKFSRTKQ